MGRGGCEFQGRSRLAVAGALALALAGCAGGPPPSMYDLSAARPPPARAVRAQFRVGQPTATADLDSEHILVREGQSLATLAGARWPQSLPALFRARLAQSFQNAGLARFIDGPAANANYEVDLDIRAFELDAEAKEVHVDIAAWIVSLGTGRIVADQIFALRMPVASTGASDVAAAMDQAASTVMTEIVAFVARAL
jgi:cholesterol transport system auxiliary component